MISLDWFDFHQHIDTIREHAARSFSLLRFTASPSSRLNVDTFFNSLTPPKAIQLANFYRIIVLRITVYFQFLNCYSLVVRYTFPSIFSPCLCLCLILYRFLL